MDINSLDKKGILSNDVFIEIYEETDEILRARMIVDCSERAKELGVKKHFDTLLRAFTKAKRNYNQTIANGSETDFDGPYPVLYTGGWSASEDGITILTQYGVKTACSHPIQPIQTLINAETGCVKTKLAFKVRGRWKEIVVDKETISSNNRIVNLSKYGVRVTSENARALVQYLSDIESLNESKITEQISTSKLGWFKECFMPYDDRIVFDNEDGLAGIYDSITKCGSYDTWLDLIRAIRKSGRAEPLLYLAAAFGSPLLYKLNALPFIVDLYEETGKGKTVALMVAASVWANPEENKYWVRSDATKVSLEVMLDCLNHLPLMVDDLSQIQKQMKDDFSAYVYNLCAGGGRSRANANLGLQRQRSWKNIILTNSERSLVNETMQGGAINRIIEMEAAPGYIFEDAPKVVATLKANYGFAGKHFIDVLKQIGDTEIKAIQRDFLGRLNARAAEIGEEKEEKQILPMSILLTADKIATDYIFQDGVYLDLNTCFDWLKSRVAVSENERAYEFILSEVDIHRNNFVPDACGNYKGDIWGVIDNGYVIIHNNIFKSMCEHGNFSGKSFLSWAARNGLIQQDKAGKNTKGKRLNGKLERCIFLKMERGDPGDGFVSMEELSTEEQEELPFT